MHHNQSKAVHSRLTTSTSGISFEISHFLKHKSERKKKQDFFHLKSWKAEGEFFFKMKIIIWIVSLKGIAAGWDLELEIYVTLEVECFQVSS